MSDLERRWGGLPIPAAALHGFELHEGSGIWLSLNSDGCRCILLRNDTVKPSGTALFETKGVTASIEELQVAASPVTSWIVVLCRDSKYWEPFQAFAESLHDELTKKTTDNVAITMKVLRTWRWLWEADQSSLTKDGALGLIGELWFLLRWAGISEALPTWLGPEGSLHDFVGQGVVVEVKASQSPNRKGPTHKISSLQQLTPVEGKTLYLFSLSIVPDPGAGNSLNRLVQLGMDALADDLHQQEVFRSKLSRVGWVNSKTNELDFPFRVSAEQLYVVDASFPSLREESFVDGIPFAVGTITYDLDLSVCSDWRLATAAEEGNRLLGGLVPSD